MKIDFYVLGSKSPDRKILMENAGLFPLLVLPGDYDENDKANEPVKQAELIAKKKGMNVLKKLRIKLKNNYAEVIQELELAKDQKEYNVIQITADTIVSCKSEIFGKAKNSLEAYSTLSKLQGRSHKLITAYHIKHLVFDVDARVLKEIHSLTGSSVTLVKFDVMSDSEIRGYIDTDEWRGKAGCYAIQYTASQFIKSIDGSYSGVVGLPVFQIVKELENMGFEIRPRQRVHGGSLSDFIIT
ncbi:MAG: nucleoside triphosphate pyrophosphatase [Promethearchaeota archaeon]